MRKIKCFVLGDDTVGKSSLLVTFCSGWFPKDYIPYSINNYYKNLLYNQDPVKLEIFDTNGDDIYDEIRRTTCTNVDVFIICFSLADRNSLSRVESKWIQEIRNSHQNVPYVLVGLKKDLQNNEQAVSTAQGEEVKSRISAYSYVECSSSNHDNVDLVFKTVLDSILEPESEPEPQPQLQPAQPQQPPSPVPEQKVPQESKSRSNRSENRRTKKFKCDLL
ncbi:rac-like GTP-binding protein RAC2 [Histomonas meleagridis]|uniref:rac-like GTP-binding protein RAC2 n=1 Tax=Histomonas meleagridis TaxID=135588 RepID=UPI0035596175|nr:rac-like GTP-binding protein RAC2 [Histomonas meleagridis]KAH0797900.1 rac-like GTP-binding protein RAC2 [Histomonas meleagridis]